MRYIVFPDQSEGDTHVGRKRLQALLASEPTRSLFIRAMGRLLYRDMQCAEEAIEDVEDWARDVRYAVPNDKKQPSFASLQELFRDHEQFSSDEWIMLSNGWYVTRVNARLLASLLKEHCHANAILVNVSPDLVGYREKVLLTSNDEIVGFRRFYDDSIAYKPIKDSWPHHILIRSAMLKHLLSDPSWQLNMSTELFLQQLYNADKQLVSIEIAGFAYAVANDTDVHRVCSEELREEPQVQISPRKRSAGAIQARMIGPVVVGEEAVIAEDAIIVGPSLIGSHVHIGDRAVIYQSILLAGTEVPEGAYLNKQICRGELNAEVDKDSDAVESVNVDPWSWTTVPDFHRYRRWPRYSYPVHIKRICDAIFGAIMLVLFLPVFPIIALAIKLDSSGPVFYRAKRQGRYGRGFDCMKFRTMRVGADALQDGLRGTNEVDGPQFKMDDDPRVSRVGRFLRETYLDEIPQFLNVLKGDMSVVGPRPSPLSENTLCPWWRDGRLSVRPGVTGLWQVKRTRKLGQDFQEWITFDTQYVEGLNLRMDLRICWQTVVLMAGKCIQQFLHH
ncbi:sugar transferase [Planctomycetota bacterium]